MSRFSGLLRREQSWITKPLFRFRLTSDVLFLASINALFDYLDLNSNQGNYFFSLNIY